MLTFSLFHINSVYGRIIKKHIRTGTSLPYFAFKKGEIIKGKMLRNKYYFNSLKMKGLIDFPVFPSVV